VTDTRASLEADARQAEQAHADRLDGICPTCRGEFHIRGVDCEACGGDGKYRRCEICDAQLSLSNRWTDDQGTTRCRTCHLAINAEEANEADARCAELVSAAARILTTRKGCA